MCRASKSCSSTSEDQTSTEPAGPGVQPRCKGREQGPLDPRQQGGRPRTSAPESASSPPVAQGVDRGRRVEDPHLCGCGFTPPGTGIGTQEPRQDARGGMVVGHTIRVRCPCIIGRANVSDLHPSEGPTIQRSTKVPVGTPPPPSLSLRRPCPKSIPAVFRHGRSRARGCPRVPIRDRRIRPSDHRCQHDPRRGFRSLTSKRGNTRWDRGRRLCGD